MNVKEIVEKYLKEYGYDGLYEPGECACVTADLMPCDSEAALNCLPGHIYPAAKGSEYTFMIGETKEKVGEFAYPPPEKPITGQDIHARYFYLSMIDRSIESSMASFMFLEKATQAFSEVKSIKGVRYLSEAVKYQSIASRWSFYARMWALKWDVLYPAQQEYK